MESSILALYAEILVPQIYSFENTKFCKGTYYLRVTKIQSWNPSIAQAYEEISTI